MLVSSFAWRLWQSAWLPRPRLAWRAQKLPKIGESAIYEQIKFATWGYAMLKYMCMKLIHYGHTCFDPTLWTEPYQRLGNPKPYGGLWTSPKNSKYGWKYWCEQEDFYINKLQEFFELTIEGNILTGDKNTGHINLDRLKYLKVDAIYLPESQIWNKAFWGWDCETVLILNKDCIK